MGMLLHRTLLELEAQGKGKTTKAEDISPKPLEEEKIEEVKEEPKKKAKKTPKK